MDGRGTADQVERAAQPPVDSTAGAAHTREVDPLTVTRRLQAEGRWYGQIELERDEMMKLAKAQFPDKIERQQWVYGELDRLYPPIDLVKTREKISHFTAVVDDEKISHSAKPDDGQIQGLAAIPDAWPEIPANASLAAEIGWVQANRLRIVTERPGGATVVDLGKALSPAPSWSALGWAAWPARCTSPRPGGR